MKIFRYILGISLIILSIFLVGCETTDNSDDLDQKPWTQRESWEGGMGVPF